MIRVMIVDDELPIREWLQYTLHKAKLPVEICALCSNGRDALEAYRVHRPQLVFTDIKMPEKDGIALLQELRALDPSVYVVMLTSHDSFEYARKSLKYNANEYVLKTEINGEILTRIYSSCQQQVRTRAQTPAAEPRAALLLCETFPPLRLDESYSETALLSQLGQHVSPADFRSFFIAAVSLSEILQDSRWQERLQTISFPLKARLTVFYYDRQTMLFLLSMQELHSMARLQSGRREIVRLLRQAADAPMGVSLLHEGTVCFTGAASEALTALRQQLFFRGEQGILCFEQVDLQEQPFEAAVTEVLHAISNRQILTATAGIRRLLDEITQHRICSAAMLQDAAERIITSFELVARSRELDSLASQCRETCRRIRGCTHFEELQDHLLLLLSSLELNLSEQEYSHHIQRAIAYIHANYAEIRRVSDVSNHLSLNSEYFCRVFKQETGTTFNNYLTSYRIQRAKQLLDTTDMKIVDVASAVGYPSLSYFSRVFKQETGIAPFRYRDGA